MNVRQVCKLLFALLTACLVSLSSASHAGAYNHDMSAYQKIAGEALKRAQANDLAGAHKAMVDLEDKWDSGTKDLKAADAALWDKVDQRMDAGIKSTEGKDSKKAAADIKALLEELGHVASAK